VAGFLSRLIHFWSSPFKLIFSVLKQDICSFSVACRLIMVSTQPHVKWIQRTFNGVKRPEREAGHSPHLYAVYLRLLPLKKYGFKSSVHKGYPAWDAFFIWDFLYGISKHRSASSSFFPHQSHSDIWPDIKHTVENM